MTSRLLNLLGTHFLAKAMHVEAEPLMRRALAIFVASLGAEHPNTRTVKRSYGLLLAAMNSSTEE